jgi:hypothetical protein
MQGAAAKKARRTVIGQTLGGRASFKALHECLKLHLPSSFVSTTLLTRGYFLILFDKFSPDFDANAHGSKSLLTHSIKVQFPDLHEQFRNAKALTILASKLGEVLDIEAADSYIKRPAGPMVTVEVQDITKLVGYIRIRRWQREPTPLTSFCKTFSTPVCQTSVENAVNLGITRVLAPPTCSSPRRGMCNPILHEERAQEGPQVRALLLRS